MSIFKDIGDFIRSPHALIVALCVFNLNQYDKFRDVRIDNQLAEDSLKETSFKRDSLGFEIKTKEKELLILDAKLKIVDDTLNTYREQITSTRGEIYRLQNSKEAHEQKVESLKKKSSELEGEYSTVFSVVKLISDQYEASRRENDSLRSVLDSLKRSVTPN